MHYPSEQCAVLQRPLLLGAVCPQMSEAVTTTLFLMVTVHPAAIAIAADEARRQRFLLTTMHLRYRWRIVR